MDKNLVQSEFTVRGMTCSGCATTVRKSLSNIKDVENLEVDFKSGKVLLSAPRKIKSIEVSGALKPYPSYYLDEAFSFWSDLGIWKRSTFNTLNCLIGCSIGDFGMIIYLQAFHPSVGMAMQMVLATIAGLCTSVLLETILLQRREKMPLSLAFRTAFSMSFISMVAMEVAMNTTDFMITGGKAAFGQPQYWFALCLALVAGFFVPLPYNYYRLRKYNLSCH